MEGCDEFQGFLFSTPQPAADIERLLRDQAPPNVRVAGGPLEEKKVTHARR
jgi:hypothetical protein